MASYTLNRGMTTRKQQYKEYIQSEEWSLKRREALYIHGNYCNKCGVQNKLHIHHKTYSNLFSENVLNDLIPLCEVCHKLLHKFHKQSGMTLLHASDRFISGFTKRSARRLKVFKKKQAIKSRRLRLRFKKKKLVLPLSTKQAPKIHNKKQKERIEYVSVPHVKKVFSYDLQAFMKQYDLTEETARSILGM